MKQENMQDKLDAAKDLLDQCTESLHRCGKARRSFQRRNASDAATEAAPMEASVASKVDLENAGKALAQALQLLRPTQSDALIDTLPALLQSGGGISKQAEESGTAFGFGRNQVEAFVRVLANAGDQIGGVVRSVNEEDLPVLVQFFTNHPDPTHWGFGYCEQSELPPTVVSFATACSRAGVLPSIYVLYCLAHVLHKAHSEAQP